jgi:alpha-tubulin suppressor-like RCC1 family protein
MSWLSRKPRAGLTTWLVTGVLSVASCRDNQITGPSDTAGPTDPAAQSEPALAAAVTIALAFWQVSGGKDHTCGVTTDWLAYCWGNKQNGTLGVGTSNGDEGRLAPVAVVGDLHFKQVSAGWRLTCGVTPDNLAYCWGGNWAGQLGIGTRTGPEHCDTDEVVEGIPCSTRPVAVAGGLRFAQVAVGSEHACGVTSTDRRAYCWGHNGSGELGDGTTTPRLQPVAVVGGLHFRQVSTRYHHTCGVTTENQAYCWGINSVGQLGDSTEVARRLRPTPVSGTRQFRQIDAGVNHTCGVTTSDRAFCWGNGGGGQLGNGKTYLSFWPRAVAGGLSFRRVTAGSIHTCGETTSNLAYCWGYNGDGELGDGTTTSHLTPVAVVGGLYFKQLSAGWYHTCGKTSAAVLYCWGENAYGKLGDGTYTYRLRPKPVASPM